MTIAVDNLARDTSQAMGDYVHGQKVKSKRLRGAYVTSLLARLPPWGDLIKEHGGQILTKR